MANPWHIQSIYDFQYFNCPSCIFKNHSKQEFVNHVYNIHPNFIDHLFNVEDNSLEDIIFPNIEIKEEQFSEEPSENALESEKSLFVKVENKSNVAVVCILCEEVFYKFSNYLSHCKRVHKGTKLPNFNVDHKNSPSQSDKNEIVEFAQSDIKIEELTEIQENVPESCCVEGCFSFVGSEIDVDFFNAKRSNFEQNELWTKAINRKNPDGSLWYPKKSDLICSSHFVNGFPSKDVSNPDYVPSKFPKTENQDHLSEENYDMEFEKLIKEDISIFKINENIPNEMETVHEKNIKCDQCNKEFNHSTSLYRHIRNIHEGQKNYKCKICNQAFTQSSSLKTHITSVHNDGKCHKCELCDQEFLDKNDYKIHIKKFHKDEIKCDLCNKVFLKNCSLKRHIRTVHEGVKEAQCNQCGQAFTQASSLKLHIRVGFFSENPNAANVRHTLLHLKSLNLNSFEKCKICL